MFQLDLLDDDKAMRRLNGALKSLGPKKWLMGGGPVVTQRDTIIVFRRLHSARKRPSMLIQYHRSQKNGTLTTRHVGVDSICLAF